MPDPNIMDQLGNLLGLGGSGAAGGAFWMNMKTRELLTEHKQHVAENYVNNDRLQQLEAKIDKIYEYIIQGK